MTAVQGPPPIRRAGTEYAIRIEDLGVRYNLRFNRKTTIRGSFGQMLGRGGAEQFWALRHISLRVLHGESLAVIGPNGAGKSTLLQVLAGIMRPSEGAVDVRGQVSGLLALGAGFDRELSGRENILLGGAFLGLEDAVTRELLPSIMEFADLGEFIDAPLKTYSSGMRARLGFAIATAVDPDILLLDEVLATGDADFRTKSKARVIELVRSGQGGGARDPRHGLGERVLQPGGPDRTRCVDRRGRARRRGRGPPATLRGSARTPDRGRRSRRRRPTDRQTLRAPSGRTGPPRSASESSSGT